MATLMQWWAAALCAGWTWARLHARAAIGVSTAACERRADQRLRAPPQTGDTSLHLATNKNRAKAVELLIAYKANVNIQNKVRRPFSPRADVPSGCGRREVHADVLAPSPLRSAPRLCTAPPGTA